MIISRKYQLEIINKNTGNRESNAIAEIFQYFGSNIDINEEIRKIVPYDFDFNVIKEITTVPQELLQNLCVN